MRARSARRLSVLPARTQLSSVQRSSGVNVRAVGCLLMPHHDIERFSLQLSTSLPPLERDQKLEGFNSYTQLDFNISNKQTATASVAVYPQKLEYMGLNTFTPQPSTADYHQRGYQIYGQHRYLTGPECSDITDQL